MAGKIRFWPEGCAIGCGALVVLAVVIGAVGWLGMMQLSGQALESRAALEEAYPSQETYTPPLDGAVAPDRLETFLAVREALAPWCTIFTAHRGVFDRMEAYEQSEEEPPTGEFAADARSLPKTLWRLGRDVHRYATARNETLLEHGMGNGEFTWIYVAAYFGWLGHEPVEFIPGDDDGLKVYGGRVRGNVMDMMRRHITELEAALARDPGSAPPGAAESLALWRAELVAMENQPGRAPFQDGLPPALAASFEPFREDLERLYCPATGELELARTEKTGLWYDHR